MQNQITKGFRLSPQQKRVWSLQQNSSAYCVQGALLLEGHLKPEILNCALQNVVNRQRILRTNFSRLPGIKMPVMVITDSSSWSWHNINLSDLEAEEQDAKIESLFLEQRLQGFDLEQGAILRSFLLKLSATKHVLIVSLPSLCGDAWTLKNLVAEISKAYSAYLQGEEVSDPVVQYVQFSEWHNQLLEDDDAEAGKEYWEQQDFSNANRLKLPFESESLPQSKFNPSCLSVTLGSDVLEKIEALVQQYETSASVVLLTCWQILLWRVTGQSDIVVGTIYDRRDGEYEPLHNVLGLLATWLPIKIHVVPDLHFTEALELVKKATVDAEEWQDYFCWNEDRITSQIGFEWVEWSDQWLSAGVSFSLYKQYTCIEPFKVKLTCISSNNSLSVDVHYDTNLFSVDAIQRLSRQFQTLLTSAIENPEALISHLEMLTPSDRQQLLVEFNHTQIDYPLDQCIHQRFEEQVKKTPNTIAVVFEDQQLTYAQLNQKANQLAHTLQQRGVKPEVLVGLWVERSLDMIVGLLGILKAGGAYLPIDPALPIEALTFRLQDAQVPILLTQQSLVETCPTLAAQVICLDTDWDTMAQQSDTNPSSEVTRENLVYVIYTSGSTGKPKGVAVEHRQLLNYLNGIINQLDLPRGASFATVSTFAADLGNTAIFSALCTGGSLSIISQERSTNPEALADYCNHHPIDCLKIVPSHLKALLSASHPEKILPKKHLILGGEALSWILVEKLQQYAPTCQIVNHYGPTETTIGVLTYSIEDRAIWERSQTVPIGRPLANTQVYILDEHLQPVPIGVGGELYIGGDNLARGYLNQPDLTNERFIPNPFSHESGSRLYKTGDVARYLPDGTIEFLGRIDHQLKIRGFRIEPGEIESTLALHPEIEQAITLGRHDESGNQRLIAYIVPHSQSDISVSDLRNFLNEKLPEYMIPSTFVQLKALPLTLNGKVNRQALPAPDNVRPELEAKFVPPRTPIEDTIARIWAQVLEIERVGIHDNFFELGGDSIMSIQIIARVNQAGLQATPKQLFEYPTVAGLAAVVGTTPTFDAEQGMVTGSLPLTPNQYEFFEQKPDNPHHWSQGLLLEVHDAMVPALLEQTVQDLLEHHDALRLRFIPTESGWQLVNSGWDADETVPFSYIDLSGQSAADQDTAIDTTISQLQASLNLTEGSLLQVALFNLGENQPHRLLLVMHHLVVDSVSWGILLADLQQVYQQLSQGQLVQLSPKTTSFKQWSEYLHYARSAQLQQERDYWLQASHQSISPLPVDDPNGANTTDWVQTIVVSLSVQETHALLQDVPAAYRTQINDVLLTALVQTFNQWTQGHSLLVDLEGQGRDAIANDIDLSRTVGRFTTRFPALLTLEGILEPGEALKAIKEQLRSIPNQGIDYGVLRYLNEDRSIVASLPQAEVRFSYLDSFETVLSESSWFEPIKPIPGINPSTNRRYLLEINGFVLEEQLQLEWTYNAKIHHPETIQQLTTRFVETLRSLITHCQSANARDYTPSDFPKANLNQKDLDQFLAKLNQRTNKTS
ncbi:MAG: amino acid adenylation domain-containing protein [Coleofasciculus sp. B1-GNL1-01]|uniref:amino acid adenylation domain-containing protein n=1 Tax=Coleofasciculus sp. B1-GNL1-01 TaxID=3068484 RepID=UPI0032F92C4A